MHGGCVVPLRAGDGATHVRARGCVRCGMHRAGRGCAGGRECAARGSSAAAAARVCVNGSGGEKEGGKGEGGRRIVVRLSAEVEVVVPERERCELAAHPH